jgi:LDH2 family malate/lactate/ureidoglycolate dehydrogenase
VLRLPWYVARLRTGVMRPLTITRLVRDRGSTLVLDGQDGVGQVIAARAARLAIARARRQGIAAVAVRRSNHFGTAAYFTRMAPPAGCIALLATNASPAMAPWGGTEPRVGTNPWSIAAPAGRRDMVVMDVANTAAARGKLHVAKQRGEPIPLGWAVGPDGAATTDPARALRGLMLPMGGHKGYAIAFMLDVLAGVLSGSGFGSDVSGPYQAERPGRSGHLYIALHVAAFCEPAEFAARMEALIADVKSARAAPGHEVLVPGEREQRHADRVLREGVDLPAATFDELSRLSRETGAPLPV